MGVAGVAPAGEDPVHLFLDDYWRGLTGEGQASGWFGQNTVPQELRRLGELQATIPKEDPFGPEFEAYTRAFLESNLAPGFGVSGSVGRVVSALPMDKASRLARAAAMGFRTDMPLYHGTASDFRAFDPASLGRTTQAPTARLGVWAALDPDLAGSFAQKAATTGSGQNIVQMFHRAQRPGVLRLPDDVLDTEVAATISLGLEEGYDAFLLRNFTRADGTKTDILMVKDPAQLRSVHATFDPAKRDSPDLLAGLVPPGFAALFIEGGGGDSEE